MKAKARRKPITDETCRALGIQNQLDPTAVEMFIANHNGPKLQAFNQTTGKIEPIKNERQLERLLLCFCRAVEHATN